MDFDFEFPCRNCGSLIRAKHEWIGRTASCNCCHYSFVIPAPFASGASETVVSVAVAGVPNRNAESGLARVPTRSHAVSATPDGSRQDQPAVAAATSLLPPILLRKRSAESLVLMAFAGVVLAGVGWLAANHSESAASSMQKPAHVSPLILPQLPDEIPVKAERDRLRGEANDLEEKTQALRLECQRLEEQRDQLTKEIERLTATTRTLQTMAVADFLLFDRALGAIGVQQEDTGQFRVLEFMEGDATELAMRMARKRHKPLIARDAQLVQLILAECPPNTPVPSHLAPRVANYWRPQRFVPVAPGQQVEFVCFRDLGTNSHRLGVYLGHDEQQVRFKAFDQTEQAVPRSRIAIGTARKGRGDELCRLANETDFLDYCLLTIAQKLGTADNEHGYVQLVVHTGIDFPEGLIDEYVAADLSIRVGSSSFALSEQDQTYRDQSSSSLADKLTNERQPWYGREKSTYQGRSDTSGSRHSTFSRSSEGHDNLKINVEGGRFEVNVRTKLDHFAQQILDEAYAKLTRLGVPLLEREELKTVAEERSLGEGGQFEAKEFTPLLCATHLAKIEVGPGPQRQTCRISVRLTSLDTGQTIWGETQEQLLRGQAPSDYYLLDCGKVAVLNAVGAGRAGDSLPLFPPPVSENWISAMEPRLVYIEPSPSPDILQIRDLFDEQVRQFPRSQVDTAQAKLIQSIDDVPRNNLLRYVAWRIARNAMPSAGRVTTVEGGRAVISLGRDRGVQPGDKFRVIRLVDGNARDGGDLAQQVLPVEMVATEVSNTSSAATSADIGVELLWSDTTPVLAGDIITPSRADAVRLSMAALDFEEIPRDEAKILRLDNPARRRQVAQDTYDAAQLLGKKLQDSLLRLNVPVRAPGAPDNASSQRQSLLPFGASTRPGASTGSPQSAGVTHLLSGTIRASLHDSFVVRLAITADQRSAPADTFTFRVSAEQLRGWKP